MNDVSTSGGVGPGRARIHDVVIAVDPELATAPFAQVVDQVVRGISSGEIPTGTRLPSVRALAAGLGLAVNTVAKAYRVLEAEGHVETRGRNGTIVVGTGTSDMLSTDMARVVQAAKRSGLDLDETVGLLRRLW
ncbi:GntR family transcriptional regulator [Luteococcus sp. Sow4_B9]|uniref:GntR family transcriptional regulator n=1 Tax=Luteococcus sp. Sow4_B9 TaxID=3438792 RepID=UPI003F98CF60